MESRGDGLYIDGRAAGKEVMLSTYCSDHRKPLRSKSFLLRPQQRSLEIGEDLGGHGRISDRPKMRSDSYVTWLCEVSLHVICEG